MRMNPASTKISATGKSELARTLGMKTKIKKMPSEMKVAYKLLTLFSKHYLYYTILILILFVAKRLILYMYVIWRGLAKCFNFNST